MRKNNTVFFRRRTGLSQLSPYSSIRETDAPGLYLPDRLQLTKQGWNSGLSDSRLDKQQWVFHAGSSSCGAPSSTRLSCLALFSDSLISTLESSDTSISLML